MAHDYASAAAETDDLRTDYLIVGAGLAGCTVGYLLRQAGKDVLLLEIKDAETKDKLCAGALAPQTIQLLSEYFGEDVEEALHPVYMDRMRHRFEGMEVLRDLRGTLLSVPRKRLDDYALRRCLEAGGRLLDRVCVKAIDTEGGKAACCDLRTGKRFTVRFETVVGADGAASATRRLITGKNPQVIPAVEVEVPKVGNDFLMECWREKVGYAWYIPQDERATCGAGFWEGPAAFCRESLQSFMREISLDFDARTLRGACIPSGRDILFRAGENAYFLGDAAGLTMPLLGSGIHYAVLCAGALADALASGGSYEDLMRPWADGIASKGSKAAMLQAMRNLIVHKNGTPIEPLF